MIGLIVVVVGILYGTLLFWATRAAYRWATKSGWPKWQCQLAASGGFLAIYLPVFWDHIPTVVTHQYSCMTEAGFWEYKSIAQWSKENSGVVETLVSPRVSPSSRRGDMDNYVTTYLVNQRFASTVKHGGQYPVNRWRHEKQLVDRKNDEVLARYVDFSTSQLRPQAGWAGWKMWLHVEHCPGGSMNSVRLSSLVEAAHGLGRKE